jgi:hypothetical protein
MKKEARKKIIIHDITENAKSTQEPEDIENTGIFAKVAAKVNGTDKPKEKKMDEQSEILMALKE